SSTVAFVHGSSTRSLPSLPVPPSPECMRRCRNRSTPERIPCTANSSTSVRGAGCIAAARGQGTQPSSACQELVSPRQFGDGSDPHQFTLPGYPIFYEMYRRVSALFPSLARFAVGRLAYRSMYASLPSPASAEQYMFWSTARHARSFRDEWAAAPIAMQQAG